MQARLEVIAVHAVPAVWCEHERRKSLSAERHTGLKNRVRQEGTLPTLGHTAVVTGVEHVALESLKLGPEGS